MRQVPDRYPGSRAVHFAVLVSLCACAFLLMLSSVSAASEGGEGGVTAGGASTSGQCWIEPWLCGDEEPECLIEPWECGGEEPEGTHEFGRYIVVFWDWVEDPAAVARKQVEKYGGNLGFIYEHALKGYSAEYPTDVVDEVEGEPTVKYVEEDQVISLCEWEPMSCEEEGPEPGPEPKPECLIEPWECGEEDEGSEPESTGSGPTQTGPESLSAVSGPTDAGSASIGSISPTPRASSFKRCGRDRVHRNGRCVSHRALAGRACRKRSGSARRRCIQRSRALGLSIR